MSNSELLRSTRESLKGSDVFEALLTAHNLHEVMTDKQFFEFSTTVLMCLFDDDLFPKLHEVAEISMEKTAKVDDALNALKEALDVLLQ